MKKKRKRSASSSSSDSTSSRLSSSSSSSSSRRRSRKKKKKRRRSERGSKRHRRISSRESRRSSESRSERGRKEREEEAEELEWFPAPSCTSATFLNQKGGLAFEARDEDEKDADDKRICQLYSLSAASEEESDSSLREGKKRDRKEGRVRKNSPIRSPERRSRSRETAMEDTLRENRDSESKRRSSLDEDQMQKSLCSSAEVEFPRKSSFSGSASKHLGNRMRLDSNSLDDGRYENRGRGNICLEVKREKESAGRALLCEKPESAGNHNEQGARPKKDLPANLLNIFNQIAQFEKEKGVKPKK